MSSTTAVLDRDLGRGRPPALPTQEGGDPPRRSQDGAAAPPIANGILAILAFIVFESMLFAGLLGGFSVMRFGSKIWPPPGQPYLPIAVTWANTIVLLGSLVPLTLAGRAQRRGDTRRFIPLLAATAFLGALFLAIQGSEWVRLLGHGMKVAKGVYGGIFILLIGTHGLHVLGAVIWLAVLAALAWAAPAGAKRATESERTSMLHARRAGLQMATIYWWFVCVVWIALFGLVYLA